MAHKVKITFHGDKVNGWIAVPGIIEHNYGEDHQMHVDVRMSDDALHNLALTLAYWGMHKVQGGGWGFIRPTVKVGKTVREVIDFISPRHEDGVDSRPFHLVDRLTKDTRKFEFGYNGTEVR